VLSFDLACLRRVLFFLVLGGALVRFGLPAARQCFLALGALVRFGSPAARRFFSWLAALSLDLACLRLRRFLPWIGVLSFDLVLRFVLRVFSWLAALSFLSVVSLWLVACVCVFALSLARALAYSARALSSLQRGWPCFEAKRARVS
jgi:hypothetical protein